MSYISTSSEYGDTAVVVFPLTLVFFFQNRFRKLTKNYLKIFPQFPSFCSVHSALKKGRKWSKNRSTPTA